MSRVVTYGKQPDKPEGALREIVFPELALLDQGTNEGWLSRVLESDGANTRDLPRTIFFQPLNAGHDDAIAVGSIFEMTVDGETGKLSGRGWLMDDPAGYGRQAAFAVKSRMVDHNSIDIAEVDKYKVVDHGNVWDDDYVMEVRFQEWKLGATTILAIPAFANAYAEVGDEIMAALGDDTEPLINDAASKFSAHMALEIVAGMETRPKWEYFHRPEPDIPHKIMVGEPDEAGWIPVFGHLCRWNQPHTGYDGRKVYAPRSKNNYATFCQPSVLTDRGLVNTGPIVLYGGHISLKDAADDPKNAWADVRVIDGKHGVWMCGVVRPHIAQDTAQVYVARASRTSGHWKGGDLRMIVSVNAEGYPIEAELDEYDLVASFAAEAPAPIPQALLTFAPIEDDAEKARVREWLMSVLDTSGDHGDENASDESGGTWDRPELGQVLEELLEQAAIEERARLLAEGGLADLID